MPFKKTVGGTAHLQGMTIYLFRLVLAGDCSNSMQLLRLLPMCVSLLAKGADSYSVIELVLRSMAEEQ